MAKLQKKIKTDNKEYAVKRLIEIKKLTSQLEDEENILKGDLLNWMHEGEIIIFENAWRVCRIISHTPVVTVEAASAKLPVEDFMQVVKVSITELKKKLGQEVIEKMATGFVEKDYISVKRM